MSRDIADRVVTWVADTVMSAVREHGERLLSAMGAFCGILAVHLLIRSHLGSGYTVPGAALLVGSMGASAVLLYAVPHGPLSQPWPVVGGNTLSALVGVACYQYLPEVAFSAPLAVALAIVVMHYLKCLHPPGGATALTAVIGGSDLHQLGYAFAFYPVAASAVLLVTIATVFNAPFPWRRYPLAWLKQSQPRSCDRSGGISREDLQYALQHMRGFVDAGESELMAIYEQAFLHARRKRIRPHELEEGACYSNGGVGSHWSVRQILQAGANQREGKVYYRVVAGANQDECAGCSRREFAEWAHVRVISQASTWRVA